MSRKSSAVQDSQETKKSDPFVQPLDQPSSPSGDGSSQETRKTDLATLNLPSSSSDELSQETKKSNLPGHSDLETTSEEIFLPPTKKRKS